MSAEDTSKTDVVSTTKDKTWETEKGIRKMADLLRGRKGMPSRHAVELGKRPMAKKYFPDLKTKEDVNSVGHALVQNSYIHRSERDAKNKKILKPTPKQDFSPEGYYTWMYEGSKTLRNIMTALLIIGFLVITCFPIWPQWAKVALWYMSVTFLIFIAIFVVYWLLPNIFDDNLSVADSFVPLYSLRATDSSERIYRVVGLVAFACFCVWVKNQPTDFDEYMELTKQFTDDIYSGKLLSDMSQKDQDNIDAVKVPDLEDLLKDEDDEDEDQDAKFDKILDEDEEENSKFSKAAEDDDDEVVDRDL
ncbi:Translocation protein Sec62 [Phytophthora cactorum]|nr:Translocation protein Sec62 [Phytophthora cactorum]